MSGLLLALFATLMAGLGARDMVLAGRISAAHGPAGGLLAVAMLCAGVSSALAGVAAGFVLPMLTPDARVMLAGMALVLAGLEALVLRPGRKPVEPTHSLGAFALVLLALQLTDPVRFVVFAVGVGTAAPIPAAIGGAVASAALLAASISQPDLADSAWLGRARRLVGGLLLLIGGWLAWGALP
ncbi:MAG TPA: hypothetical protein PKE25_07745 [Novosphingobium sp.]|nr:hypothetical protein [Novosphingobium sp.]